MKPIVLILLSGLAFIAGFMGFLWLVAPEPVGNLPPVPEAPVAPPEPPLPEAEYPPLKDLEGGWVLNPVWHGYMGVAIQFRRDGTFDYWQYSDVVTGDEPKYPVSGHWKWNGGILELEPKGRLHDNHWYVWRYKGKSALLPAYARRWQIKDGDAHADRLLFRVPEFDPARPFESMMQAAERPEPGIKQ